ncbi:MAG: sodium-dependent transporter [Gammaproteobacteria bacterium]|nr:sodium-dependent transporter [Gammaproteobacteria bacterium]MBT4492889.1 sodium-dependent transporter [Gammaproteobacteria bacterium]MBT7371388.1 sodium-dependent transporter [Gammaproteobacteria bacterium]
MWSSRIMFILAAAGSAVGLGNIWRFPYVAGENGGGAFVLTYLVCIFLIGMPIMVAETILGRAGRKSPINTMQDLTARSNAWSGWQVIGWMGVLAGFMILSYYAVIAGWAVAYLFDMASGTFVGADSTFANDAFKSLTGDVWAVVGWHSLFMACTILISARGVGKGLEMTVKYLMPMLFILLLALVLWAALTSGHFLEGMTFLFSIKSEDFSGDAVLVAMGQAFFTLSLGMGAIMAYGAYLPKSASIVGSATTIALLDTVVALLSGMVIFPIVFANGLESSAGPGLMFITLPIAFGQMSGGQLFGTVFFLLVTFAAITSAISLVEPAIAWLVEKLKVSRAAAAVSIGVLAWFWGLGTAFSFNIWDDVMILPEKTFFDTMDYVSNNIILPLGGVLIATFTGWFLNRAIFDEELGDLSGWLKTVLMLLIRFVAPLGVLVVFVMSFI